MASTPEDDVQFYVEGVLGRNRRILAKTITLIESALPNHRNLARQIIDSLLPHSGKAVRLGITGVPGVGKSTFIEQLGLMLVEKGQRVGVLAVDPSSSRSGGSVMADKTRMERLALSGEAYIRPSPAGGLLGGVAHKTRETMLVCEAAGYDVMIVETVGVGQSETAVASMVDFFLVLMLAGAGDEIQGIKKGVLELADAIAVNKADGDNIEKAKQARKAYASALHLLTPASPTWTPPVMTASAMTGAGIEEIWAAVISHHDKHTASGELVLKHQRQSVDWMWALLESGLKRRLYDHPLIKERLLVTTKAVENGTVSPSAAAAELLFLLDKREAVDNLKNLPVKSEKT